jgi:integrase
MVTPIRAARWTSDGDAADGVAPRRGRRPLYPPSRPARGANHRWSALGGQRPGLRPAQRPTDRAQVRLALLEILLREAGVREGRLHDGRHTAATLLLTAGVHPRVDMKVLGHAQMRTTTDTYSHVLPALGRDAANRMGNALWGPPAP